VVAPINLQGPTLNITAVKNGANPWVGLTNDVATSLGNQTIAISFGAGGNTWARSGMSGGLGANCGSGIGCRTNADCAPNLTCQGAGPKTCLP